MVRRDRSGQRDLGSASLAVAVLVTLGPLLLPHGEWRSIGGLTGFLVLGFFGFAAWSIGHRAAFSVLTAALGVRIVVIYFEVSGSLMSTGRAAVVDMLIDNQSIFAPYRAPREEERGRALAVHPSEGGPDGECEIDDSRGRASMATVVILCVHNPWFCENIGVSRCPEGEDPILRCKEVSLVLLVGLLFVGGLRTTAYAYASGSDANDGRILGYWQRGEGEAVIEVRRHAGGYHGVIVASERRPEVVGVEVFRQLRYDANARTWHGRAYSIKRKREVRIDIEVPNTDQLELTAHVLVFTRRVQFKRIPDADVAGLLLAKR